MLRNLAGVGALESQDSRVIGLSDDIARSMSAVSVRVAVVPGRNVIGIELPNVGREMVYLRELLASARTFCFRAHFWPPRELLASARTSGFRAHV